MGFMDKLNAGMNSAAKTVKAGVDNVKKDAKIVEREAKVASLTTELGKLVLAKLEAGEDFGAEIAEKYEQIKAAKDTIAEMKATKQAMIEKKYCPSCGAQVKKDARFCASCGAQLPVEAEVVASDIAEEVTETAEEVVEEVQEAAEAAEAPAEETI